MSESLSFALHPPPPPLSGAPPVEKSMSSGVRRSMSSVPSALRRPWSRPANGRMSRAGRTHGYEKWISHARRTCAPQCLLVVANISSSASRCPPDQRPLEQRGYPSRIRFRFRPSSLRVAEVAGLAASLYETAAPKGSKCTPLFRPCRNSLRMVARKLSGANYAAEHVTEHTRLTALLG